MMMDFARDTFFDNHPDPMWVYDLETLRFLEVNSAAQTKYGYSRDEFLAMTIADIRPVEDVDALVENVTSVTSGLDEAGVWRHRLKSGEIIFVDITSHPLDYQGRSAELVSARDVTRLVQADARLAERTSLLRIAGRAARLGGWRVELNSERITWTAETAAIHEVPEGTPPSVESAIHFYIPEHRSRIEAAYGACARHGEPFDEVLQLVTAKGNRIWVRSVGEAERDSTGAICAVQGAIQDVSELVEARERSQGLSRRLRETLEDISDAFFTLDEEWRFTFVNGEAERVLGRSRADLVGKVVWDEFPDAVGSTFQEAYERVAATRQTARFTAYYPPLDKWFQVSAHPAPEGLAVYFRDVTAERARDEQLRLLETAVSRQNDILLITEAEPIDAPGGPKIVYVNDTFVRRTGYSREEAIGNTPRMLRGPKTQRSELDRIREALVQWKPVRAELINYAKSGEEFWMELDLTPISDDQGRYTHWVGVQRDVTERKRAEEAMRISNERFHLVAKATSDIICDCDLEHGTIWWNEVGMSLFADNPAVDMTDPSTWINRVHPNDRDRVVDAIHAVIDGMDSNWVDEYRIISADGSEKHMIDRGFVIRNENGKAVRMISSLTDVTSWSEQEEQLRQSQKLEALGQLTGGVAHDFNNLLTIILGNAEILSERLTDQQQLRLLAEMTATAAERGAELTNRLLAFARRQPLAPALVDVNRLVTGMDGLLRRTLAEDIEIEIVRGGGLWIAEVDPGQLEVALLNLALNARDAMTGGGRLTLEMGNTVLDDSYARLHHEVEPGQYVMVSVSDTGTGMPQGIAERAFEPFFTTKEVGSGSGLGLSMVYGFVKQSRGHAKIYSEVGNGTTVKLYFPRARTTEGALHQAIEPLETIGGHEHILVVEDDDLVREHLLGQLRLLGYRVTDAASGPAALEALKQMADFDLLFTDIVMPGGMNGRQLAEAATALRPNLKVLFTSGYTENAIVHHGRLDHGVHLLSKPYRRQELAAKVRKALDE